MTKQEIIALLQSGEKVLIRFGTDWTFYSNHKYFGCSHTYVPEKGDHLDNDSQVATLAHRKMSYMARALKKKNITKPVTFTVEVNNGTPVEYNF
jgi:hypothetical protein